MASSESHPVHLDPSELGTKEYWDNYYQNDLDNEGGEEGGETIPVDPSELDSWFDDVNAPAKTLKFLTSTAFPLSPNNPDRSNTDPAPLVLDLGTGNGSALFSLRMEGGYNGPMVGVDYSQQSVDLASRLWRQYLQSSGGALNDSITFHQVDLMQDDPLLEPWWPSQAGGFDLVLDKGTFDAISLSSATVEDSQGLKKRICEVYPAKIVPLMAPGGYLLVTSCNWTEDEIVGWFTVDGKLEVYDTIKYPIFQFGGKKGQGVCSVCFARKV